MAAAAPPAKTRWRILVIGAQQHAIVFHTCLEYIIIIIIIHLLYIIIIIISSSSSSIIIIIIIIIIIMIMIIIIRIIIMIIIPAPYSRPYPWKKGMGPWRAPRPAGPPARRKQYDRMW